MHLQKDSLESLLSEAKELEKRYEWLQAADHYKQASGFLIESEFKEVAEIHKKIGFCHYKAAFQANTNIQFKKQLENAIRNYESIATILQNSAEKNDVIQTKNAEAMIAYINSWIEFEPSKKKSNLDEWWNLKSEILKSFDKMDNKRALGKTINDLLEGSIDFYYWIGKNREDLIKIRNQLISLGEKAIETLSLTGDEYELARAYCWTSWYYLMSNITTFAIDVKEEIRKGLEYSKKALKYSKRTGNDWLIGWAYNSAFLAADKENDMNSGFEFLNEQIEQGKITKDNYLLGFGRFGYIGYSNLLTNLQEDPEKMRKTFEANLNIAQKVIRHFQIINYRTWDAHSHIMRTYGTLASIELDSKKKYNLLKKAIENGKKALESVEGWRRSTDGLKYQNQMDALFRLLKIEKNPTQKKRLVKELLSLTRKLSKFVKAYPDIIIMYSYHALVAFSKAEFSKLNKNVQNRIGLLKESVASIANCIKLGQQFFETPRQNWTYSRFGFDCYAFAGILNELYSLTKEKTLLHRSVKLYTDAVALFSKGELITRVAESYWQKAKIQNILGEHLEAAKDYDLASKAYRKAAEKVPQFNEFFSNYSLYMNAWNRIEQAKYNHSNEKYSEAMKFYEEAAKVHEKSISWSYLAPNYFAWACMEEAESLSRSENTQKAKEAFQKTLEQFGKAEKSIKRKVGEITSSEEKELTLGLLEVSNLRRKFCQARIQIEAAKLMDRKGEYLQSSKSYGETAQNIGSFIEKVESEAERKEMEYLAILCRAWEKMAIAEETASSELYSEAARFFEQAKEYCYTSKASLWTLGNSNFCKGLAAKNRYQNTFDKSYHSMANKHVEQAANYYRRAGFQAASEYAKATQRLLDAYVYMHSAQEEVNPEKKAKYYQLTEQLLKIAASLFVKARQPEKTALVQSILATVREEKALAASLNEVMHAPTIASTTQSFMAPSPTSEASVGLEQFQHANVQANLIAGMKEVKVGESFCLSVEFVNAGREPALLTRVDDFVPPDFIVVKKPEIYRLEENCLNMKGKQIAPLELVEAKLVLQSSKKGVYQLKPTVHYLDEVGQNKSLQLKSVEIQVKEVILSDRVSTGTKELDSLLLGGIPKEYAFVLIGPPSDERAALIQNFLKAGIKNDEVVFYVATEADVLESFLENPNSHLFLCNPKPKTKVPDLPNITKLRSKTDINNLNMVLARESRNQQTQQKPKRLCVEIISDVLLEYGATTTRKWVSELLTDLGSKGFTTLAVLDSSMHPVDQANAVINLFDGEINLTQTGVPPNCKKSLIIKKLRGKDYIKNPICLAKI